MGRMYLGKIVMFIIAMFSSLSLTGVVLFTALGHIFDMYWPSIKQYFINKMSYQKTSENFIFLVAYYTFILNVDSKKAAKKLIKETIVAPADQKSVEDLFVYYTDKYIPRKNKKTEYIDKRISESIATFQTSRDLDDKLRFFKLIESIFDEQITNPSPQDINTLKQIAIFLGVDYIREYKANNRYEYKKQSDTQQEKPNQKKAPKNTSSYISQEVKDAFKVLNFNAETPPTLTTLKTEYKKNVRKYHPDILKGQNVSAKKLEQAEKKLTELNKSMAIAKNFLANR